MIGLFLSREVVFHHAVDDYQPPHDAHQRLGFCFAFTELVVERES
jgi:hypothetical protein